MKRLVFCFDGTWNTLNEFTPTNVVLTAASIQRTADDGRTQIIHYDEGVGTGSTEHLTGGMFGAGLVEHVREAYRFLIFNYDAGDEIYVFGFSRGAFSARSFIGFLRHVGPLRRLHAGRIDQALDLYRHRLDEKAGAEQDLLQFRADYSSDVCIGKTDDAFRCANVTGYTTGFPRSVKGRWHKRRFSASSAAGSRKGGLSFAVRRRALPARVATADRSRGCAMPAVQPLSMVASIALRSSLPGLASAACMIAERASGSPMAPAATSCATE